PAAVVAYNHPGAAVVPVHGNADRGFPVAVFGGVGEEVEHDLTNRGRVGVHRERVDGDDLGRVVPQDGGAEIADGLLDHGHEVQRLLGEHHGAALDVPGQGHAIHE